MDSVYSPSRTDRPTGARNWLRVGIFSVAVLSVGALVGSALTVKGWSPFKGSGDNAPLVLPESQPRINQALTLNTGFSAVAKAVTPAVVVIRTKSRVNPQQSPFLNPFEDFFNEPDDNDGFPQPRRRVPQPAPNAPKSKDRKGQLVPTGTGSGVIVTPDGYILTNNHVVDGAEEVQVELADKRTFKAKVIGTDPPSDIAVIKLDATGLPTAAWGDSSAPSYSNSIVTGCLAGTTAPRSTRTFMFSRLSCTNCNTPGPVVAVVADCVVAGVLRAGVASVLVPGFALPLVGVGGAGVVVVVLEGVTVEVVGNPDFKVTFVMFSDPFISNTTERVSACGTKVTSARARSFCSAGINSASIL